MAVGSVVVSRFASTNWVSDLLTNFYAHIFVLAVPTVLYLLVRRRPLLGGLLAAAAIFAVIPVLPFIFGSHPGVVEEGPVLRVATTNILYENQNFSEVISELRDLDADVIAVHEVTPDWVDALAALEDEYSYSLCAPQPNTYGQCVFSRIEAGGEMVELGAPGFPTFVGRASVEGADLVVSSIHGSFPRFGGGTRIRNAQFEELGQIVAQSNACAVVVGDFNTVPTNPVLEELNTAASLNYASLGTGFGNSWQSVFPSWLGGLRLDHVLVSNDVEVMSHRFVEITGTDHEAAVVDLRLPESCADGPSAG